MPLNLLFLQRKSHLATAQQRAIKYIKENYNDFFHLALSKLATARRIFVVGLMGSRSIAPVREQCLGFVRGCIYLLKPAYGDIWDSFNDIYKKDLVMSISFPRYARIT